MGLRPALETLLFTNPSSRRRGAGTVREAVTIVTRCTGTCYLVPHNANEPENRRAKDEQEQELTPPSMA